MTAITDGLYGYEIVILVFGIILFFVMLIPLIQRLRKGTSPTALLPFFLLSIGMVGYPSVQSITIGKDLITLNKTTHKLASSPSDPALRQTVKTTVEKLEGRPIAEPGNLTVVATAQYMLGNESAANAKVQQALAANPNLEAARSLKESIASDQRIATLTQQIAANPSNDQAKTSLASELKDVSAVQKANPLALTHLAQAQAAIGQYSKAFETANKAEEIAPNGPARPLVNSLKEIMPRDSKRAN
jgi:tetratricopeptide (TPR) repeat protein